MQDAPDTTDKSRRDISRYAVPLGIIAFCVWAYWLSTQFERVPPILKRGMQPSDFPQLVIGLIIMLSVWLLFRDESEAPERLTKMVQMTMGLLIGFLLISQVDLFLALGLFAASLTALWGERRVLAIVLVGLIAPIAVFFLFDGIFEVRFPRGLLTNLWYG
ncbi:Tripartite tricarboxylate transporter TctB family protein [Shimia gijangensis]|uniref:Tripartite tricarboxylate transporter TctB family protein n=1 Tax=Shimia gijangensis TaxID=1470563 RepID=A0A1M6S956_9RHOB|nr:tripartite tricarboxylate transporter TctB family protein [Shimia gijangensis]SHK41283.1 Tripartite tricarboxylate transporter TctB family protein [Shimia gijangensis]